MVLAGFLAEPGVKILQLTAATARFFASIFARLRPAGTRIPINGIRVAAAVERRGRLLTFDRDSSRIPGLEHALLTT